MSLDTLLDKIEHPETTARPQQIDPETNELYPWWVFKPDGSIVFDPNKFDASHSYPARGETIRFNSNPDHEIESPFDLNNLRFIDPEEVTRAYDNVVQDAKEKPDKPICILIGTGGTISMAKEMGALKPKFTPMELVKMAGKKEKYAMAEVIFPTAIDSSQMEIDYVADLAIAMSWLYAKIENEKLCQNFGGFIVTHGTDTGAQSQTYLSMMLGSNCPFNVFYVVSQRTTEMEDSDALDNLKSVLDLSKKLLGKKYPRGIHGIWAGGKFGRLHNGPTTRKISDKDIDLYKDHGSDDGLIRKTRFGFDAQLDFYHRRDRCKKTYGGDKWRPLILRGHNIVQELNSDLGDDPQKYADEITRSDAQFFIIKTFGSFTANRKIVDAIVKAARANGKLIFAVNPFPEGSVEHQYADAQYLTAQGIVPLKMLAHAAYAKLLWAYRAFGKDAKWKILKFMTENDFVNEQLYSYESQWLEIADLDVPVPRQKQKRELLEGDPEKDVRELKKELLLTDAHLANDMTKLARKHPASLSVIGLDAFAAERRKELARDAMQNEAEEPTYISEKDRNSLVCLTDEKTRDIILNTRDLIMSLVSDTVFETIKRQEPRLNSPDRATVDFFSKKVLEPVIETEYPKSELYKCVNQEGYIPGISVATCIAYAIQNFVWEVLGKFESESSPPFLLDQVKDSNLWLKTKAVTEKISEVIIANTKAVTNYVNNVKIPRVGQPSLQRMDPKLH